MFIGVRSRIATAIRFAKRGSHSTHFRVPLIPSVPGSARTLPSLLLGLLGAVTASAATPPPDVGITEAPSGTRRFEDVFAPLRTERAALSPDGKWLAYTVHENHDLALVVMSADRPGDVKGRVLVLRDRLASAMMRQRAEEDTPARIVWMRWVQPNRLVFETNRVFPFMSDDRWATARGEIMAMDADGGNARTLANPNEIHHLRPLPVIIPDKPIGKRPSEGEDAAAKVTEPKIHTVFDTLPSQEPASLHVIGLHPRDEQSILIRTVGQPFDLYDVNVNTGKLHERDQGLGNRGDLGLLDPWGVPRIVVAHSRHAKFPRPFVLEPTTTFGRERPLDQVCHLRGFDVSPASYFGTRSVPLGFDEQANILYYASNVGRDTFGIYTIDLKTGQRTSPTIEAPRTDLYHPEPTTFGEASSFDYESVDDQAQKLSDAIAWGETPNLVADEETRDPYFTADPSLVFDRFSHRLVGVRFEGTVRSGVWLTPELQAVQNWLHDYLPGTSAEIMEWDRSLRRFLIETESATDPGGFYVLDRSQQKLLEFARHSPRLDQRSAAAMRTFSFTLPDGSTIGGVIALPTKARVKPVPLVVLCPSTPWEHQTAKYSREFEVLTRMGIAVARYNGHGAWGSGTKHRLAITHGYEEVQVADLIATVNHLAAHYGISPSRVALIGRGHGGFVALRALQLHPGAFRCAVTIDAEIDIAGWLDTARRDQAAFGFTLMREMLGDRAHLQAAPLVRHPELIRAPIFTLAYRGDSPAERSRFALNRQLNATVARQAADTTFFELEPDHEAELPAAAADEWRRIEDFLNLTLYDYHVQLGETKPVPDQPAQGIRPLREMLPPLKPILDPPPR
jgi:pimeloyl-ACP methyl ester carboxylesterase